MLIVTTTCLVINTMLINCFHLLISANCAYIQRKHQWIIEISIFPQRIDNSAKKCSHSCIVTSPCDTFVHGGSGVIPIDFNCHVRTFMALRPNLVQLRKETKPTFGRTNSHLSTFVYFILYIKCLLESTLPFGPPELLASPPNSIKQNKQ